MHRLAIESLERRRLLSVSVAESEPNNSRSNADVIARMEDADVLVSGQIGTRHDHDWFSIDLRPGDVLGAVTNGQDGLDTVIHLVNSAGQVMVANDDSGPGAVYLPPESPLPRNQGVVQNSSTYYVIQDAGTYYLEVSSLEHDSAGAYDLDVHVARPGLETKPIGTRQVLFLDFDGAKVDFGGFYYPGGGAVRMSSMARSLGAWGLTAADENAVIDLVLAKVTNILSTHVRANGSNGDFAATGIPGQFDIEIRNSRDHRDTFGKDALVSRVVLGGISEGAVPQPVETGVAQYLDVGNFKNDDEAVVNINFIAPALEQIPIQPPTSIVDFVAHAMSVLAAHEAGHIFGCYHTDQPSFFEGTPNIMDKDLIQTVGPDLVFGSADDIDLQFGVDRYEAIEELDFDGGINDTLNTVSFGLSTGIAAPSARSSSAPVHSPPLIDRHAKAATRLIDTLQL